MIVNVDGPHRYGRKGQHVYESVIEVWVVISQVPCRSLVVRENGLNGREV